MSLQEKAAKSGGVGASKVIAVTSTTTKFPFHRSTSTFRTRSLRAPSRSNRTLIESANRNDLYDRLNVYAGGAALHCAIVSFLESSQSVSLLETSSCARTTFPSLAAFNFSDIFYLTSRSDVLSEHRLTVSPLADPSAVIWYTVRPSFYSLQ